MIIVITAKVTVDNDSSIVVVKALNLVWARTKR